MTWEHGRQKRGLQGRAGCHVLNECHLIRAESFCPSILFPSWTQQHYVLRTNMFSLFGEQFFQKKLYLTSKLMVMTVALQGIKPRQCQHCIVVCGKHYNTEIHITFV